MPELLKGHALSMLSRDDYGVYAVRDPALVILHCDLALTVRPEIIQRAILSHAGKPSCDLMCKHRGKRHVLLCLAAGVAKHYTLVSGAP